MINADKIQVTGNKGNAKQYHRYSGYQGGLKTINFNDLRAKAPERIIEEAVRGMMPKNSLGRAMFKKLKVYRGAEHKHASQQPKPLDI